LTQHANKTAGPAIFSAPISSPLPDNRSEMRFLWTYLIVGIIFAFGFVCASTFAVGMSPSRRAPRRAEPDPSTFDQE